MKPYKHHENSQYRLRKAENIFYNKTCKRRKIAGSKAKFIIHHNVIYNKMALIIEIDETNVLFDAKYNIM